jgi:flavorubredoxin
MPNPSSAAHRILDDTFLLPARLGETESLFPVQVNAMVIHGAEPVVVDTAAPVHRSHFLEQLFALVEPADVRWVFLSHDDADHAGNLAAVMDACPAATLATSWPAMLRLAAGGLTIQPDRWREVADGDFIDIGDRVLVVQRPPLYDSAAMYGVFDTQTEVFWGGDSFGSAHWSPALEASDVPFDEWRRGFVDFHHSQSPWLEGFDGRWWNHVVDRFAERRPRAIASAHGPIIRGEQVSLAIEVLRELPQLPIRQRQHGGGRERIVRAQCRTL